MFHQPVGHVRCRKCTAAGPFVLYITVIITEVCQSGFYVLHVGLRTIALQYYKYRATSDVVVEGAPEGNRSGHMVSFADILLIALERISY